VLLKPLIALVPAVLVLALSAVVFVKRRNLAAFLQLAGSSCVVIVVLTHVCEALGLFPSMRFGEPDSVGHYLDLTSAVLGVMLFIVGWLFRVRG